MNPSTENLQPLPHAAQNRCFGCGPANPIGLHLEFFLASDGAVVCIVAVPDTFEGPPGYVHGGIIATLLDEVSSKAVRSHGLVAMTRHLEIDYRRPVHSSTHVRLEARLTHSDGRKHWTEARILSAENSVLAEAKGLFVEVRPRREREAPKDEASPHA